MTTSAGADPLPKTLRPREDLGRIRLGLVVVPLGVRPLPDGAGILDAGVKNSRRLPVAIVALGYRRSRGEGVPQ